MKKRLRTGLFAIALVAMCATLLAQHFTAAAKCTTDPGDETRVAEPRAETPSPPPPALPGMRLLTRGAAM